MGLPFSGTVLGADWHRSPQSKDACVDIDSDENPHWSCCRHHRVLVREIGGLRNVYGSALNANTPRAMCDHCRHSWQHEQ
mmetsp:Transcript_6550/g.10070  ORF Transcript_6550/g.10070 Transcript_6550/m.10070 type:complete len:80 (-) Transcript_6550:160-399(-)